MRATEVINVHLLLRFSVQPSFRSICLANAYENPKEHFLIRGKVLEKNTNSPIPGAVVIIEEINKGVITDQDGNYELLGLPKGKYKLKFVCLTYKDLITPEYYLSKENSPLIIDVNLEDDTNLLDEVVVQSIRRENTELSAINAIRASSQVMSAVSSSEITKTPDKNAAEVVKRVPGISIIDDRYILIRGLPRRYNNVCLNS